MVFPHFPAHYSSILSLSRRNYPDFLVHFPFGFEGDHFVATHGSNLLVPSVSRPRKGLTIVPNRPVRDHHFPVKPSQPIGMSFLVLFPNSLIRAKNQFVKNGAPEFWPKFPKSLSKWKALYKSSPWPSVGKNRSNKSNPILLDSKDYTF